MELTDEHWLIVRDPVAAAQSWDVTVRPGLEGGVFHGAVRLARIDELPPSAPPSFTVAGGRLSYIPQPSLTFGMFAVGPDAVAEGAFSMALGAAAHTYGAHGISIGQDSLTYGNGVAIGGATRATDYASAFGYHAQAHHLGTTALGTHANAVGNYSTALAGTTSRDYALALGGSSNGLFSVSVGATANGDSSWAAAFGQSDGVGSVAIAAWAGGRKSFAANSGSAFGEYSTAIGRGTKTHPSIPYQTALGVYNEAPAADDLITIGNGSVDETNPAQPIEHRSNALVLKKNGTMQVSGDLHVGGVLRVWPAGDIAMSQDFQSGLPPATPRPTPAQP